MKLIYLAEICLFVVAVEPSNSFAIQYCNNFPMLHNLASGFNCKSFYNKLWLLKLEKIGGNRSKKYQN